MRCGAGRRPEPQLQAFGQHSFFVIREKPSSIVHNGVIMSSVIVRSLDNFRHQIDAGPHTFYADEPADVGGDDSGPDPYELLLSALGACTSMTLRMYANRKGIPLESVEVRLRHTREYLKDCEECDKEPRQIDVIIRKITLHGQLEQAQRQRLLEIAEKCPVHRTLVGTITIRDILEHAAG
jgi:putative redox protein